MSVRVLAVPQLRAGSACILRTAENHRAGDCCACGTVPLSVNAYSQGLFKIKSELVLNNVEFYNLQASNLVQGVYNTSVWCVANHSSSCLFMILFY